MSHRPLVSIARGLLPAALALAAATSVAGAGVFYVDDNAAGDPGPGDPGISDPQEDGTAEHPFDSIQECMDVAADGDECVVLPGTYVGAGNRDLDPAGKAITVRSIDPHDPGVVAATIIDCQGSEADPHRGFQFFSGEELDTRVSGFTIANGCTPGSGGAIYCYYFSSPTIANCRFADCQARSGGAVYCYMSFPDFIGCRFSGNAVGHYGGAVYCSNSYPGLAWCSFSGNSAEDGGGAIFCTDSGPIVTGCLFAGNSTAATGGAMYCYANSSPSIANCAFVLNTADEGGAIYCRLHSSPRVVNCTFTANVAAARGGAVCCFRGEGPIVANSILWGDYAPHGPELALVAAADTSTLTVHHSDVEGGVSLAFVEGSSVLVYGPGNIQEDPRFIDADGDDDDFATWHDNDIRPAADSPCSDAGDNESLPADMLDLDSDGDTTEAVPFDLGGLARIISGNVDMGAHEEPSGRAPALVSAVSRKTHGSRGAFDIRMDLGPHPEPPVECRSDGPTLLVLSFSEPIRAADGDITDGNELMLTSGEVELIEHSGREMTVHLSGVTPRACFGVLLLGVEDPAGNPLTGAVESSLRVLPADQGGDGTVDVSDFTAIKCDRYQAVDAHNFRSDLNADGVIDVDDLQCVKNNRFTRLASCP